MITEKVDFIPHAYDKYVPWVQDLYRNADEIKNGPARKPPVTSITDAMLTFFKQCGDQGDASARAVRFFKEAQQAAVDFNERLLHGLVEPGSKRRHTGPISLAPMEFAGLTNYTAGQIITLRRYIRDLKADPALNDDDFKKLGVMSSDKTYDFNHDQPVLREPIQRPDGTEIHIVSKLGYQTVRLYVRRGKETVFHKLDTTNGTVFVDTWQPEGAEPVDCHYFAIFVADGKEVGIASADVTIAIRKIT